MLKKLVYSMVLHLRCKIAIWTVRISTVSYCQGSVHDISVCNTVIFTKPCSSRSACLFYFCTWLKGESWSLILYQNILKRSCHKYESCLEKRMDEVVEFRTWMKQIYHCRKHRASVFTRLFQSLRLVPTISKSQLAL